MLGGQFVPGQGSGCDTGLRVENGSQRIGVPSNRRFVKKITWMAPVDQIGAGAFFVKKFADTKNTCESAISHLEWRESQVAAEGRKGTQDRGPFSGFRLARMLLPEAFAMIADFFSTTTIGQYTMAAPQQQAVTPRGPYTAPVFFVFDFLRESFHKSVGTQSRPLRGGKDGSVCRVM